MSSQSASAAQTERNVLTGAPLSAQFHMLRKRAQQLPVAQHINELLEAIRKHSITIVVGDAGSGLTTQLPKAILTSCKELYQGKRIALTQPRRSTAELVAQELADAVDVRLGDEVGCRHGFMDRRSTATLLEVITDGTLVQAAKSSQDLSAYSVIILADAHERTVATDLLLGLMKLLLQDRRKDNLKVVIMSATIDADIFRDYFPGSEVVTVPGRAYPVREMYLQENPQDMVETVVRMIIHIHGRGRAGNILVFVSGIAPMECILSGVRKALFEPGARWDSTRFGELALFPLHAQLSEEDQQKAVRSAPPPTTVGKPGRKLVVATKIAETSITLIGFTHVVDTLRTKSKVWNPRDESWSMPEVPVSKAVAQQRAGRAGRTREGISWRMCARQSFTDTFAEHTVPQIMEDDLLAVCLTLLKWDFDPTSFPFIVQPARETIMKAIGLLYELGAVSSIGRLTAPQSDLFTRLPLNPYACLMVIAGRRYQCLSEMVIIAAMIEASEGGANLHLRPRNDDEKALLSEARRSFRHTTGEHLMLYIVFMAWKYACLTGQQMAWARENMLQHAVLRTADRTRDGILSALHKVKDFKFSEVPLDEPAHYVPILKAIVMSNHLRVARRVRVVVLPSGKSCPVYQTLRTNIEARLGQGVDIGGLSGLDQWVVYNELSRHPKQDTLRLVTAVPLEYVISAQPAYWASNAELLIKDGTQQKVTEMIASMGNLSLDTVVGQMPSPEAAGPTN